MTKEEIEIEDLRAALTQAHGKLFEAGKLAGQLTDALAQIKQWAEAYPVAVFLPVLGSDLDRAAELLQQHGISLGAIHASWARHILQGIGDICDRALDLTARP